MPSKSPFFSIHTHSRYSSKDATESVYALVQKAKMLGYPGLVLTDHGNMAGAVQLYQECKKVGIKPYPGFEGYLIDPTYSSDDPAEDDEYSGKAKRYHYGIFCINEEGYKSLVRFSSLSHTRPRFNRFPRHTLADLLDFGAKHGKDVVLTTGCYFGWITQRLVNQGYEAAKRAVEQLAMYFPNLVVELQHHNTKHTDTHWTDASIVASLVDIAEELGLPVMAGQDTHYLDQREKGAHDLLKRMFSIDEFPGDSYHLASAEWVEDHYPRHIWAKVEQTARWLLSIHDVKITPLDDYQTRLPVMAKDADTELRDLCMAWYQKEIAGSPKISKLQRGVILKRLLTELDVVQKVGQANYFLIVDDVIKWCHQRKICVEARGSANGSLICFAMGITQVDPVLWGTIFERFMSVDRIKPPDVDIDIEDQRREELLAYLEQKWGSIRIGTWAQLGSRSDDPEKGSALVSYRSYLSRCCEDEADTMIQEDPKLKKGDKDALAKDIFKVNFGEVKGLEDVKRIDMADYDGLRALIRMGSDSVHPSGVTRSYGTHAGGVLLPGSDLDFRDYIPTMFVASAEKRVGGGIVTQFDMDDVDALGWQKLDILGQVSLSIMQNTQRNLGSATPDQFGWIPYDDKAACALLREGRQDNGIFHFEGWTKSKGAAEMGIRNTRDAILAGALYMPGAMDSGEKDKYIARRKSAEERAKITYHSAVFQKNLDFTYGTVIYQEQPLQILRDYGMSMKDINVMFKVLKDSGKGAEQRNAVRLAPLKEQFRRLATDIDPADFEAAWHQITGFVAYGFNRAHASGYGIRAYRFAYLKAHHELEFMGALLQSAAGDADDERKYVREARRLGIRVLSPDVNVSGVSWSIDVKKGAIRRGLLSIKGVGVSAAEAIVAAAPFLDIKDLITRVPARAVSGGAVYLKTGQLTGRLKDLDDSDALESLKPENL